VETGETWRCECGAEWLVALLAGKLPYWQKCFPFVRNAIPWWCEVKVLAVGDTHGDSAFWTSKVIPVAKREGINRIIQLGDMGFWIHQYEGIKYMVRLNEELLAADILVYASDVRRKAL